MIRAVVRKCIPAVLAALWAMPFIHHGSTKRTVSAVSATNVVCAVDGVAGRPALPDVQANGVQDGAVDGGRKGISVGRDVLVAPSANATSNAVWLAGSALRDGLVASSADAAATTTTADAQERVHPAFDDGRFRTTLHSATNDLARPDGVELFDRWRLRGAADDAFRIAPPGWWLRLPGGFADGVTVFSRGEIRPDARTGCFPPIFTNRVSFLPQSRWHLIGAAAESGVWHALTPSNSLLVGWANAALGRNPSTPTNAVVELFRDGRFTCRYADCTAERSPVFPFDLDGDGLENSVDPNPLVAGADAHGTNAEWHLAVCSNVFEAAQGDARPSADANGVLIPDGVAWREGVNTNAYYFVDVVAERGPVPIYFVADRESRLGSPVVVAMADETNRVPLLMGVKYAVTSEAPFSVSVPADAELGATVAGRPPCRSCISIARRSQTECDVEWPVGFTFTEAVSGSERTYSVGVVPYDPGGDFEWGTDGGIAVMSLASSASCQCASGEGRTLSFACSMGCPCSGGCSVSGRYSLEGAYFAVTGGVCRCGFDDEESHVSCWCGVTGVCPCGETCLCDEHNEGAGLSVSFSRDAVIFEEAYENSPGELMPRRSTRTTLSVAASGGPRGGRLTLTTKGLEQLAPIACGPIALPQSMTLSPYEAYLVEFLCEADTESASVNDMVVDGEFVENETGKTLREKASATAVKVEFEPILTIGNSTKRHVIGVREEAICKWKPAVAQVAVTAVGDVDVRQYSGYAICIAPLTAEPIGLQMSFSGAMFPVNLSVVEPEVVFVKGMAKPREFGLPVGCSGGVGMSLDLHVSPTYVSFTGIALQEIPSDYRDPSGYFASQQFAALWSHTVERGAGEWHNISDENFFMVDNADLGDELPRMDVNGNVSHDLASGWRSGRMNWKIPVGWNERNSDDETTPVKSFQTYWQQFAIDRHGTVKVAKLNRWVQRGTNGVFTVGGTGK